GRLRRTVAAIEPSPEPTVAAATRLWQSATVEIDRLETFRAVLARRHPLGGLRLQDLDLHAVEAELLDRTDLTDLVVLGGRLSAALTVHLVQHGAIVFPHDPAAPVDVYRSRIYTAEDLYADLDSPDGYAATPDARAFAWTLDRRSGWDAYATMLRAIHDQSMTDALDEVLDGLPVVGVMGGHSAQRGSEVYAAAARLGHALAEGGLVVATGGGPGAMEAANLGAYAPDRAALAAAIHDLVSVPFYRPDLTGWARSALEARRALGVRPASDDLAGSPLRTIGIPTWFYGHEPPNVFGQGIAKYFSNALREDGLLARCTAGTVVLAGAAGTVQEIFQGVTRLYYERMIGPGGRLPPLVLVGRDYWTRVLPTWPVVTALAGTRPMSRSIHLVDRVEDACRILLP
ncbi:MAG: Rossmann fold nucleotide-binding protein, partial [Candidatus Phosphoribacter sp.]